MRPWPTSPRPICCSPSPSIWSNTLSIPAVLAQPDLPRIILADGMLMYYLDAAEVVGVHSESMDWQLAVELARKSGAVIISARFCKSASNICMPPCPIGCWRRCRSWARASWSTAPAALAAYELQRYLGQDQSRLWNFLLDTNGAFILRPIRILDTVSYFLPDADFRQRRYGNASAATAIRISSKPLASTGA